MKGEMEVDKRELRKRRKEKTVEKIQMIVIKRIKF